MLRQLVPVEELGIRLLQEGTIRQDQFGDVPRRLCRVDPAAEAVPDEPGQVSGVIKMGMRQDDGLDRLRLDRELLPVQFAQVLEPLEQPAVDKDAVARRAMSKSASVSLCGF